jgi:branched-chain amino acid transport system ATP-binding protein
MSLVMAVSDRVVVMNFGQKLMEGRPEEVRQNPDVVEAYLGKGAAQQKAA